MKVSACAAGDNAPRYYNLVVMFFTNLGITALKRCLQTIEVQTGRVRGGTEVSLDLDILLYGNWIGNSGQQTLPHPDIESRAYILRPLADLLSDTKHPRLQVTFVKLWRQSPKMPPLRTVNLTWRGRVISIAGDVTPSGGEIAGLS